MARFDRGIGILMLAASCASACYSVDGRRVATASDGTPGQADTAGQSGAQPNSVGAPNPGVVETPRGSTEQPNVVDLVKTEDAKTGTTSGSGNGSPESAGGTSMPDGAMADGAMADGAMADGAMADGAGAAGSTAMPMGGDVAAGDPNAGSNDGSPGGSATSGGAPGGTDVGVIANPVDKFFADWPAGAEPLAIGKAAAEIFTAQSLPGGSGHDDTDAYKHYKDACAWYGSLSVAEIAGEQSLIDALVAKYLPYEGTWTAFDPPTAQNTFVGVIDDSVFGIVPLEIAKFNSDPVYFREGHLAADHQVVFIAQQLRNTSDDVFHVSALQMQAYRVSTDPADRQRHMDTAANTAVSYLQSMQKPNGLLPHHLDVPGFDISWARGNGWFAAGLAELIREIPTSHPDYASIEAGYRKMMNGLLQYQVPAGQPGAGLWKQVVDSQDSRNWVETSGSAMFTYALVTGVRKGLLDVDTYGPAARAAWLGLVGQVNSSGLIQNISDTAYLPASQGYPPEMYAGDEVNYYFERPRLTGDNNGQSPLMWSAAALLRPLD